MPNMLSSANARRNWFTITSLVSRDFKLKYRRSALGVLWSVLNPLLMMIVLSVEFSTFYKFSIENYPLYVILGNVMFALMADSTSGAMNSIIESSSLIKKIRIEKLIFPLEKVLFQLVNFRCCSYTWCYSARAWAWPFPPFRCSSATYATCGASLSPHGRMPRRCSTP